MVTFEGTWLLICTFCVYWISCRRFLSRMGREHCYTSHENLTRKGRARDGKEGILEDTDSR